MFRTLRTLLPLAFILNASVALAQQDVVEDVEAPERSSGPACLFKRNDSGATTFTDTNGDASYAAVDSAGRLLVVTSTSPGAGAITKDEDSAHTTGDDGVFMLGVISTSGASVAAAGDYAQMSVGVNGAVKVDIDQAFQRSQASGLMKEEDTTASAGEAIAGIGSLRQDTISALNGADNEWTQIKSDSVGAVYTTPGTQALSVNYAAYAEASITNAYTTALTNSNRCRILDLYNGTDQALLISFDASNDHIILPAGIGKVFDIGAMARHMAANVSVKYVANPSSGSLYSSCLY